MPRVHRIRETAVVRVGGHVRSVNEPRGYPRPDPDAPRGRIAGWIVLSDGERLGVTVHCVDRWWERAAVGCTGFRRALTHLQQVAAAVGAEAPRPEWAGPGGPQSAGSRSGPTSVWSLAVTPP